VVEAYTRYLTQMGVKFVGKGDSYDIKAVHAGSAPDADVAHCHGLYWTADYSADTWEWKANTYVTVAVRNAKAVTVPSLWVAETFQRDMRFTPDVVGHGIEWQDWQHSEKPQNYVLWNKNRIGDVCDIEPFAHLARTFSNIQFVSTFMPRSGTSNIKSTGVVAHSEMKKIVQRAGVYLATTKETFGIGVLEAMTSGVPVLGYAHGGIVDLVQHGVNGYLAQPGNREDLEQGLNYCIENAETLGDNGRELAKGYSWGKAAEKIYKIYDRVLHPEPPSVSIVVPSFNYASKVETAIQSALAQTKYLRDVIVVDDGSNDDGLTERTVSAIDDKRVRFYRKENGGVATARNFGIARSDSKYICCLDADDRVEPGFLEALVPSLESSAGLGIAYSGLQYVLPDGRTGLSDWPGDWDYDEHLKRKNQIPTCCVFRRSMWERLGGYKQRYAPQGQGAEDAEFWLRAGTYGWGAKKATKEGLFVYSWMSGRASGNKDYKEVDWLELHPWTKDGKHPFASHATPVKWSHPVRQYDEPRVSVIIPVGPGHEHLLIDALDSLESQTYHKWEVIVVWDSPLGFTVNDIDYLKAYSYVKWIHIGAGHGAGHARNEGARAARGNLLLFLDADDFLLPTFLERTVQVYDSTEAAVYTDYEGWAIVDDASKLAPDLRANMRETSNGITKIGYRAAEYNCERAQRQPEAEPYLWCDINTLHPKLWYNELGGFDESLSSWEDVDYWWRMARAGHCFQRIPQELFVYRFHTGTRRQKGLDNWKSIVETLTEKYAEEKAMGCSGCGGGNKQTASPPMQQERVNNMKISDEEMILILYQHPNIGQHPVIGPVTKTFYGYRGRGEEFIVHRADVLGRPNVFVPIQLKTADVPEMQAAPLPPKRITVDTSEKDGVVSIPMASTGVTINESLANAMAAMEQALTKPPSSVMVAEAHVETSIVKRPKGRPRSVPVI
jgi:glycosyltransferase involved in cell wall biosynthesis